MPSTNIVGMRIHRFKLASDAWWYRSTIVPHAWHSTDAQPTSGQIISCTPLGLGTFPKPWHSPDAHPTAGQEESDPIGCTAVLGSVANPTPTQTTSSSATNPSTAIFFLIDSSLHNRRSVATRPGTGVWCEHPSANRALAPREEGGLRKGCGGGEPIQQASAAGT